VVLPYRRKISSPKSLASLFQDRHRYRNASFELLKKCTPVGKYSRQHGVIHSSGNIRQSGDCAASTTLFVHAFHHLFGNPSHACDLTSTDIFWPISCLSWSITCLVTRSYIDFFEKRERVLPRGKAYFNFNTLHRCLLIPHISRKTLIRRFAFKDKIW